jgi:hypothetical protein
MKVFFCAFPCSLYIIKISVTAHVGSMNKKILCGFEAKIMAWKYKLFTGREAAECAVTFYSFEYKREMFF